MKIKENIDLTRLSNTGLENEIQKYESLYCRLPQKSWSELLKGKLIALESKNIINKEDMKKIYNELTNKDLNF